MSVSIWSDQSSTKTVKADITIVGAGIAGLSTAFWLNKLSPDLKINVIEKYELCSGASGRNAGFITCGSVEHFNRLVQKHGKKEAYEIWNFSEENLKLLKENDILSEKTEFQNRGSFSLASTENEFKELQSTATLMDELNIKVDVHNEEDLRKNLHVENFVGGIHYLSDAEVHPVKLVQSIKNKLSKNVSFFFNNEVFDLTENQGVKIVRTNKAVYESDIVIFALNGYSQLVHPYFKDYIFPTRGQILLTAPIEKKLIAPCYANFVLDYFRQLPSGQLLIGGFRQLQKDVEVGYSDEVTDVIQNALEEFIKKYIPVASEARVTHRWSGIMGFSFDGMPMIGSIPTDSQSFFIGGFTAHGLGMAFHTGKCLSELIMGKSVPEFISAKRI